MDVLSNQTSRIKPLASPDSTAGGFSFAMTYAPVKSNPYQSKIRRSRVFNLWSNVFWGRLAELAEEDYETFGAIDLTDRIVKMIKQQNQQLYKHAAKPETVSLAS